MNFKATNKPNGPTTPYWLRIFKFITDPLGYVDTYSQRYGDIFSIGGGGLVYVGNPQAIKEIFTADPKLFESGRGNSVLRYLVGDNSLLLLDGDKHQRQRKLLIPPFHGERMRSYGELICNIASEVSSQWEIGKPFNLRGSMQEITIRVILQAVFGMHSGSRYDSLRQLLTALLEMTGSPLSSSILFFKFLRKDLGAWSPWGKMNLLRSQIDRLLYAEISDRRKEADSTRTDILSLMISARDERGESMSDLELRDELMTLLLAGHDTTSTALCWAFYSIHSAPKVRGSLLQELDSLDENPNPIAISRLPYLTAVCQETVRKYPVGLTTQARILKEPFQVMQYEFDAGTVLLPCIYLIHHRPDIYPEPKQFKPERFLERQYGPYEYFPFGATNRRCIGEALAMFEMKLVLATVLSRYELALTNKRSVKPQRRGVTIAPPGNMKMVLNKSKVETRHALSLQKSKVNL